MSVHNLIQPLFVRPGKKVKQEIPSMPGQYQYSVDLLVEEVLRVQDSGVPAVILFGIPEKKDDRASRAYAEDGIIQKAIRAIRQETDELTLIADVCLCEYMEHGHCGVVTERNGRKQVDNDRTLPLISKTARSVVEAGADVVAPSGMMDGMVQAIRRKLDDNGFPGVPILSYAAKYNSSFYGPFRDAAESPPRFGNRSRYQMDPANSDEALREIDLDVEQEADILMVKPALPYLDIIERATSRENLPVFAYSVSGEYAMIQAAAANDWLSEKQVALEMLTSIRRAGAEAILTYWATRAATWIDEI